MNTYRKGYYYLIINLVHKSHHVVRLSDLPIMSIVLFKITKYFFNRLKNEVDLYVDMKTRNNKHDARFSMDAPLWY